jgi:tRNA (guanine-N7-)-methyltransferase
MLDSFCGTGMSTALIAGHHYPDALGGRHRSVGSSAGKTSSHRCDNYLLLRAEAESFWLCLVEAGIQLRSHWMLYPNPWPKASQFKSDAFTAMALFRYWPS